MNSPSLCKGRFTPVRISAGFRGAMLSHEPLNSGWPLHAAFAAPGVAKMPQLLTF